MNAKMKIEADGKEQETNSLQLINDNIIHEIKIIF